MKVNSTQIIRVASYLRKKLLSIDLALHRKSRTACGGNIYLKQRLQLTVTQTRLRLKTYSNQSLNSSTRHSKL